MTDKAIRAALAAGRRVRLRGDPYHVVCINLFDDLYVESLSVEDDARPMTISDKRKCEII